MGEIRRLQIGNVTLENNLILAPMAGVTDLPFRLLCKEQGAGLLCMEMVSAKAILYKNRNTEELLTIDKRENPVSLQLFGSDPDIMSEIAKQIEDRPFDILDINMGCPKRLPVQSKSRLRSRSAKDLTRNMSMRLRWLTLRRNPVLRQWQSTAGQGHNFIRERLTGIS